MLFISISFFIYASINFMCQNKLFPANTNDSLNLRIYFFISLTYFTGESLKHKQSRNYIQ